MLGFVEHEIKVRHLCAWCICFGMSFWRTIVLHLSLVWCPSSLLLENLPLVMFCYLEGDFVHDALVLGGFYLCSATIGGWWWMLDGDLMEALLWWLGVLVDGGLAWMMLWRLGWCLGWWRFLCFSFLHSTGKLELATLEGWISQTPLGWIQENTSWV